MNPAYAQAGVSNPIEFNGEPTNGVNEVQLLTIGGTPTGGTFKVKLEGLPSSAITWSSTNNTLLTNIQTALNAHDSLGTNGCVASALSLTSGIGTILLTFGGNRAKQAIGSLMSIALNSLTGTAPTLAVTLVTAGVDATARLSAPGVRLINVSTGRSYFNNGTALQPDWVRDGNDPRYTLENYSAIPRCVKNDGYSDPTGTTGDTNLLLTDRNAFEYHIKGTQTILKPSFGANGLDVGFDQTDNDGVELSQGITARSRGAFVIGTDPAFFFSLQFSIATVAGTDDCAVGFRKAAAYTANIDDYTDMAVLNVISGDIKIETIDDNAATTTTDTTNNWLDGETHTLKVMVSSAGVVTYQIDGAAPTTVAAFTFDSGDTVVPFFFMLQANAAQTGAVNLKRWEVGLQ